MRDKQSSGVRGGADLCRAENRAAFLNDVKDCDKEDRLDVALGG